MKLGEMIRAFRDNNDMTMQEFADRSGLSKGYISMLEKNKHPQSKRELVPSFETYRKVASAMCMPLDDFLAALDGDEVVKVNATTPVPTRLMGNAENMNNFGDRLRSLRMSKSLTQEAFAAALNERYDLKINKSMVSKWENNIDTPSLNSAKYIALFFDVSLDYLLGVSDDKRVAETHMNIGEITKKESTSARLKQIMSERNLRQVDILERTLPFCRTYGVKMNKSDISQYVSGKVEPNQDKLFVLSLALNVSEGWLMGFDVSRTRSSSSFSALQLTDQEEHLVISFRGLNEDGREKAVERVEELLDVPRYREITEKVKEEVLNHLAANESV